jgi:Family of unknown function (DUF5681)
MPWAKGQSGNPGGRPKALVEIRNLARQESPAAIKRLAIERDSGDSSAARIAASIALLDRAYGKPTQPIAGDDTMAAIRVSDVQDEIARRLDRISAAENKDGIDQGPLAGTVH